MKLYAIFSKSEFYLVTSDKTEADMYWSDISSEDNSIYVPLVQTYYCSVDNHTTNDIHFLREFVASDSLHNNSEIPRI